MTHYSRPDELVFASGAKPGEVQGFPDIPRGWGVAYDQTAGIPPMEWFNALFKRGDEGLRYLLQRGIADWSATEDYPVDAHVQEGGKVWKAKVANLGKRPSVNPGEWVETALTREALKALIQEQLGGGTLNFGQWQWSSATSGGVANGYLALNATNPADATALMIAKSSAEGLDYSRSVALLRAGDTLCIQSRPGGSVAHRFRVTGELVDSGAYRSVPVVYVSGAGGVPASNALLQVLMTPAGASDMGMPLLSVQWWVSRASIPAGCAPADGQLLSRALYPDVWAAIRDGKVPKTTEATWSSDPTQRGMFTEGDGSTTFRMPDYNGKAVGSLGALFMRGDGALSSSRAGVIQRDALQNITGYLGGTRSDAPSSAANGVFAAGSSAGNFTGGGGQLSNVDFDASRVARTAVETRPLNVAGCWIIKMGSEVTNPGAIDAAAVSSTYAKLVTRVEAIEGAGMPLMSVQWWVSRASIPAGCAPADGQLLSRTLYPDVWAAIRDGKVPKTSEATWSSDPTQRGMFTEGDGSTTFRMPDYNGKAAGSLGALFMRGDGALSAGGAGAIQGSRSNSLSRVRLETTYDISTNTDMSIPEDGSYSQRLAADWVNHGIRFAKSGGETRPLNVTGCWIVKMGSGVTNQGTIDAAAISSTYAALATRVEALESRPRTLGDGQQWLDVTAQRALGTTYTNTTNQLIKARVTVQVSTSSGGSIIAQVNGSSVDRGTQSYGGNAPTSNDIEVPPGATYRFLMGSGSSGSVLTWWEMR
ncbi:phage tail protein [Metapseudomonas otitidis]|uniref:phage tail protein n=1 Tax=Metapseudomonas otitidis TaxID=319939 RepID=UPI001CA3C6B8|nr:phage tail protein [Pseudomonas otitidis]QZX81789.1 phage tail protein [Pseudomonas otitidis]